MKRAGFILAGLFLVLLVVGVRWPQPTSAAEPPPFDDLFLAPQGQKPENNWRVCRDLGIGPVPGLGIRRQRFRLCHGQGWEVLAYCLEPNLPAPAVGTRCTRITGNTYFCGSGIQRLREYSIVETPTPVTTPTPLPTSTLTPTATATPTTPAPPAQPPQETRPPARPPTRRQGTPRAPSGGRGNFDLGYLMSLDWLAGPTRTPFYPRLKTPTPFQPHAPTQIPAKTEPLQGFYGLDLTNPEHRVRILIFPQDKRINAGKPILISFLPGQRCNYGDNRGCVNSYQSEAGGLVTFITVHSGMGGEGQAFRHAMEGTGINRAGFSLNEVRQHLRALEGAEVVILQGKRRYEGFTLSVAARLPSKSMRAYFNTPIWGALDFAAGFDEMLSELRDSDLPLLVFETCGWKMPGEPLGRGATDTTASVYLGVIQKKP
jgi:hypothetical protein